jgi:hypothetical protein
VEIQARAFVPSKSSVLLGEIFHREIVALDQRPCSTYRVPIYFFTIREVTALATAWIRSASFLAPVSEFSLDRADDFKDGVKSQQGGIMEGILVLAAWVVIAWFCTEIAVNRGHSRSRWSFLALFFGPLALAAVLLLPRVSNTSSAASQLRHS